MSVDEHAEDRVAMLEAENQFLKGRLHDFEENRTRIYFFPANWTPALVRELADTVAHVHGRGVVLIPKVGITDPEVCIARDIKRDEILEIMNVLVEAQKALFQKAASQVQRQPVGLPARPVAALPPLSHNQLEKATRKINDFARRIG